MNPQIVHIWAKGAGMHPTQNLFKTYCDTWAPYDQIVSPGNAGTVPPEHRCSACWSSRKRTLDFLWRVTQGMAE